MHHALAATLVLAIFVSGCTAPPPTVADAGVDFAATQPWIANKSGRAQTFDDAFATWEKVAEFTVDYPRNPLDARPACKTTTLAAAVQAIRVTSRLEGELGSGIVTSNMAAVSAGGPLDSEPLALAFHAQGDVFLEQAADVGASLGFNGATVEHSFPRVQDARLLDAPTTEIGCKTKGWANLSAKIVIEVGTPVSND